MSLIFRNRKSIDNICGGNMYGVEADNGTITSSTTKQKSMDTWWTCSDPRTLLSFLSLHFRNEDIFKKKKTTICTFFCLFILHYPPKLLTVWLSWGHSVSWSHILTFINSCSLNLLHMNGIVMMWGGIRLIFDGWWNIICGKVFREKIGQIVLLVYSYPFKNGFFTDISIGEYCSVYSTLLNLWYFVLPFAGVHMRLNHQSTWIIKTQILFEALVPNLLECV